MFELETLLSVEDAINKNGIAFELQSQDFKLRITFSENKEFSNLYFLDLKSNEEIKTFVKINLFFSETIKNILNDYVNEELNEMINELVRRTIKHCK
jgi:hypothetical protein